MSAKSYLWIEDRKGKAGYIFWKTLMHEICPEVIVESKKNNSELVKAVKALSDEKSQYIIVFDNSFDNVQLYWEQKMLKKAVEARSNVFLLNLLCFEYTLLEFNKLIDWIYAPEDEFLEKRAGAIAAREKLIQVIKSGELNYKAIQEVMDYDNNVDDHNIEQLSARLLFDLTRNTGFEVSKGKIGECWIKKCCEWTGRQENDICGLEHTRLSVTDKMKSIYSGTSLSGEFKNTKLEVLI